MRTSRMANVETRDAKFACASQTRNWNRESYNFTTLDCELGDSGFVTPLPVASSHATRGSCGFLAREPGRDGAGPLAATLDTREGGAQRYHASGMASCAQATAHSARWRLGLLYRFFRGCGLHRGCLGLGAVCPGSLWTPEVSGHFGHFFRRIAEFGRHAVEHRFC